MGATLATFKLSGKVPLRSRQFKRYDSGLARKDIAVYKEA